MVWVRCWISRDIEYLPNRSSTPDYRDETVNESDRVEKIRTVEIPRGKKYLETQSTISSSTAAVVPGDSWVGVLVIFSNRIPNAACDFTSSALPVRAGKNRTGDISRAELRSRMGYGCIHLPLDNNTLSLAIDAYIIVRAHAQRGTHLDIAARTQHAKPYTGRVFGGQVIGQALRAAQLTLPTEDARNPRKIHSFHSYFLRPGDTERPIVYDVESIRDGRSVSTRRVTAVQNGEKIFHLTSSFDACRGGLSHSTKMPDVPGPEGLAAEQDHAREFAEKIPAFLRERFVSEQPIECRPVKFHNPVCPEKADPVRHLWIKATDVLGDDIDPSLHECLLAFFSDVNLLSTTLLPHGRTFWEGGIAAATIDHSMWFHGTVDMNSWLLYHVESPWSGEGRGLARGQIFDPKTGKLVASTAQEGVIRLREKKEGA